MIFWTTDPPRAKYPKKNMKNKNERCIVKIKTMKYYFNKTIKGTFEEAIDKVTQWLKEEGFGILTEIDIKPHISKAGVIIFVGGVLIQEIV